MPRPLLTGCAAMAIAVSALTLAALAVPVSAATAAMAVTLAVLP